MNTHNITTGCRETEVIVVNITVKKIDPNIYKLLQERADRNGVSIEKEVRTILIQALSLPISIAQVFSRHFGKSLLGIDLPLQDPEPLNLLDLS